MSPDHRLRIAAPALLAVQRTVGTTGLSVSGLVGPAAVTVGPASSLACAGGSGVAADTTAGIGPVVSGTAGLRQSQPRQRSTSRDLPVAGRQRSRHAIAHPNAMITQL